MTLRTLAAPVILAALLASLPGCGAMKLSPSEPAQQDLVAAGNAAYDQKDFAKACQELSKAGAGAGVETLHRAGVACARDGQDKADRAFTAALAANGGYAPALEGAGLTAFAAGDLSRARDMLEAAAKAGGKDPRAALTLGEAYLLSGQCDKALAAYQEALRRDGASPAKALLDGARIVCGARKASPSPAAGPASSGSPGAAGYSGSRLPSGAAQPAAPKEPAKGKPVQKTIDLNDI